MLLAIDAALDLAEADPAIRSVLLEGNAEVFCTGLDLKAALGGGDGAMDPAVAERGARQYLAVLRRFSRSPKIIACRIAGRCEAGGIGFVAAADFAVAEPGASFRLSEALIGLLPATLMPFLIRRVGFRTAYRLTLAAPLLGPAEALAAGLVDAAGADAPEALRHLLLGSERVPERTIMAAKAYFNALAPITADMEECAVGRITSMLADSEATTRIRTLMAQGVWQGATGDDVMSDVVHLTFPEDGVAVVELADRTHSNTFSQALVAGLIASFETIAASPALRAVVVHGYGSIFCPGGTRDELLGIFEGRIKFDDLPLYRLFLDCPVPVIAAMQGHALGGGLAMGLFADMVILAEESLYSANFMKYGFTPGMGATLVLPARFGSLLANEMMFSAASYHGGELARRGASCRVLKRIEVIPAARKLAREIADKPDVSVRMLKAHLAAPLREALPRSVAAELEMHRTTFVQPVVRQRIETLFGS